MQAVCPAPCWLYVRHHTGSISLLLLW
jgi:hypothetical protein